jgi:hypothetical protein
MTIFTAAFLLQTAASGVAVLVLAGLAAWARLSKAMPALDEVAARRLLSEEFPGRPLERVWISDDGRGAVAKSGPAAMVLFASGDGFVARHLPWTDMTASKVLNGRVMVRLHDFAAPRANLAFAAWPPKQGQ